MENPIVSRELKNHPTATNGEAAWSSGESDNARQYLSDVLLAEGDVFTIPEVGDDRWLYSPAVKNGSNILHPIVAISRDGATIELPMWIGHFVKEVTNSKTGDVVRSKVVLKGNKIVSFQDAITIGEQWRLLAGKKLRVDKIETIPVKKRDKQMRPVDGEARIYTYVEV